MNLLNFVYTFRARLLAVLAALLVVTLGVQYYLNYRAQQQNAQVIAQQEQALAVGLALAFESFNTRQYLDDLRKQNRLPLLEDQVGRVINILIVDKDGRILDSLDPQYNPVELEDGTDRYVDIGNVPLPPLINAGQATMDVRRLRGMTEGGADSPQAGSLRAVPVRVPTNEGSTYIIVVLDRVEPAGEDWFWRPARPLLPTLSVLLLATLATAFLLWRFTRPIQDLSEAARRVAAGDFNFRVPPTNRRDEMGALVTVFNNMIARLAQTRQLESRLNQAERSAVVGRLASAIAHEIRNPLNYINLTLDHLRTSLAPEDPQKRARVERLAEGLKSEVARINTRITEFLKYSRPSELELRPLNLRHAIDDALRMIEAQAAESDVAIKVEQKDDVPEVMVDAESLRSALTNLMINSLQAIEGRSGRITVTLSAENNRAIIRISDTGRGIAPENISQVFEPYFSTKETGTGLGLAIVKKAIDDHDGTISVESKEGEGTTFTVTLPIGDVRVQSSDAS
jgi:signal transduction histidine kinase